MSRVEAMFPMGIASLILVAMARGVASNGGKVMLVSLDGFRWDYITKVSGLGNFTRLAQSGCTVDYMNNTFPTNTFPSHYSIATGLYAESHGVVGNTMYDPERNAMFFKLKSTEGFWYDGGEPIWVTAEKQGKSSGVYFWPGSDAEIRGYRPSIYTVYNRSVPFSERVETAVSWFLAPFHKDFVALHFDEPDTTGHLYGPDSPELAAKVREMDGVLGLILNTLEDNCLIHVVNLIITSDHGMTTIDLQNRVIDLWQYLDRDMIERFPDQSGTLAAILPKPGRTECVLRAAEKIPHTTTYRKEDIPEHFHYKHNDRIMPIIIFADEGWILTINDLAIVQALPYKGHHGYSNELPSMKPIFFARGPAFREGVKSTSIKSVDIYPLMCGLLNVTVAPNNGSLERTAHFLDD